MVYTLSVTNQDAKIIYNSFLHNPVDAVVAGVGPSLCVLLKSQYISLPWD